MENQRFEALAKLFPRGNGRRGILLTLGVTRPGAGTACVPCQVDGCLQQGLTNICVRAAAA